MGRVETPDRWYSANACHGARIVLTTSTMTGIPKGPQGSNLIVFQDPCSDMFLYSLIWIVWSIFRRFFVLELSLNSTSYKKALNYCLGLKHLCYTKSLQFWGRVWFWYFYECLCYILSFLICFLFFFFFCSWSWKNRDVDSLLCHETLQVYTCWNNCLDQNLPARLHYRTPAALLGRVSIWPPLSYYVLVLIISTLCHPGCGLGQACAYKMTALCEKSVPLMEYCWFDS